VLVQARTGSGSGMLLVCDIAKGRSGGDRQMRCHVFDNDCRGRSGLRQRPNWHGSQGREGQAGGSHVAREAGPVEDCKL
jgi:hypothetical protein